MKAPPFAYVRPASVAGVVEHLSRDEPDAKILAGGQSLVPVLAMRLARPATIVDINAVEDVPGVERRGGALEVGATVRQRELERHPATAAVPLLRLSMPWIGHREVRSRGTVCGSLAHGDPAAELPAVACCVEAELQIANQQGTRTVPARTFFTSAMTTVLGPAEMLTSVRFPTATAEDGYAFAEISRRHGDYALAGVTVHVRAAGDEILRADMTAFGVSDTPVTWDAREVLRSATGAAGPDTDRRAITTSLMRDTPAIAEQLVTTSGDIHGSRGYRRRLVAALAAQELTLAYLRAVDATQGVP
ncbi:MAG: molybdopterin dehydrogenase [Propionibacteriales bacterium]|nr:molybdopterin dehydrogenase [Propionibacteriales bacterium]